MLIHPAAGEHGATLVDTGHCLHAAQTIALVEHALAGAPLQQVLNTHLHSDHCGGNAALKRRFGVPVRVPSGVYQAARDWDDDRLRYGDVASGSSASHPTGRWPTATGWCSAGAAGT